LIFRYIDKQFPIPEGKGQGEGVLPIYWHCCPPHPAFGHLLHQGEGFSGTSALIINPFVMQEPFENLHHSRETRDERDKTLIPSQKVVTPATRGRRND
jgi:hypothetical protein